MLTLVLAHAGRALAPHDLWGAWNLDPTLLVGLTGLTVLHERGRRVGTRHADPLRTWTFRCAIAVLVLALVSPLEPLSSALASAHMVQHVLLMLVAAPLLAFSAPGSAIVRGLPAGVRRSRGHVRARWGLPSSVLRAPSHPAAVWLAYVGVLWLWHSAAAYDATLRSELVHVVEHVSFLVAALLFWRLVVGGRRRLSGGTALVLVFGAAMASVFLSVLLTFASRPWYRGYASTTSAWGLDPLSDQQLAGVLMWVPAGAIHVLIALTLVATWLRESDRVRPATALVGDAPDR